MLDYPRTTEDDLRGRRFQKSGMDVYQWLLIISTHPQRHILANPRDQVEREFPA
jgi:hypothetical protein